MNLVNFGKVLLACCVICTLIRCGGGDNDEPSIIRVTGVSLDKDKVNLVAGESAPLTARVAPAEANDPGVSWASENKNVATIDNAGIVTAVAPGVTFVSVTTRDGSLKAKAEVTVVSKVVNVTGVSISLSEWTLNAGTTKELTAVVAPETATNKKIAWTSANTAVATINATGVVMGIAAGETTVSVTTEDGKFSASVRILVVVTPVTVTGVSIEKNKTVAVNKTVTIAATVVPADAVNKTVTWTSGDETIATVDANGTVTGISPGETTITATTRDGGFTDVSIVTVGTVSPKNSSISFRFTFDGHTYYVVDNPSSRRRWSEAAADAVANGGHLVHIDTYNEQQAIEKAIRDFDTFRGGSPGGMLATYAAAGVPDGGGARYLWIGATDKLAEGAWIWNGANDLGATGGSMSYVNWGRTANGSEPDDYMGRQDCAAIALDNWPLGLSYQWNDINEFNALSYIIEIDK